MYPFAESPPALTQLEFYVLLVLAHGDAHPYKIKNKIAEYSTGSVKPRDSTVYKLIGRMSDTGLIELVGPQPAGVSGKPRMHYSLGHHGLTALRHELRRLRHAVALAESAGLYDQPVPTAVDQLLQDLNRQVDPT